MVRLIESKHCVSRDAVDFFKQVNWYLCLKWLVCIIIIIMNIITLIITIIVFNISPTLASADPSSPRSLGQTPYPSLRIHRQYGNSNLDYYLQK